jgi:hypothetical protein
MFVALLLPPTIASRNEATPYLLKRTTFGNQPSTLDASRANIPRKQISSPLEIEFREIPGAISDMLTPALLRPRLSPGPIDAPS